jgi:ATP-dependent Lon protease
VRKAASSNPVVDKMSTDFRGDPSSALLEVLDPEQNNTFNDHYLDCDYDLSKVMFITTANTLDRIPRSLQDRLEVIRIAGYTETEKLQIAKKYLLKKQREANGLKEENIEFSDQGVLDIMRHYTHEAGVRNLEREIASVCRKVAVEVVKTNRSAHLRISASSLQKFLGPPKFRYGIAESEPQIGMATGLVWTELGGQLLDVEVTILPGRSKLTITGQLGDVMQESARAALSCVRSRSEQLALSPDFYQKVDIHIRIPAGAISKDGPSAGITLATALVSALCRVPVRNDLAMTGEITLRGRVLPIGGLKEKVLAAHRAGIKTILIPKENEKDSDEIPQEVLKDLTLIQVEHMDEVLKHALVLPDPDPFSRASVPRARRSSADRELLCARQTQSERDLSGLTYKRATKIVPVKTIRHRVSRRTFKLGRKRAVARCPRFGLKNYLTRSLPAQPATCDYTYPLRRPCPDYNDDTLAIALSACRPETPGQTSTSIPRQNH